MKPMAKLLFGVSLLMACQNEGKKPLNSDSSMNSEANRLIHESSPYLLQHAYNPVDWRPWNEESLAEAQKNNKPILISIGYSACHWCHVMEKESFEDDSVAQLMNEHFICIKVDREERPDIDHLYMDAVQLMSGKGGWPLNCFALPNGKPFYGGTYYPKAQWIDVLNQIAEVYRENPEKVNEYAEKLSQGLKDQSVVEIEDVPENYNSEGLMKAVREWKKSFDPQHGGNNYAPKFPMPNNFQFLLHYLKFYPDTEVEQHLIRTLDKMAMGGIYDQIGGGFARYSTDMVWKVPHFEKMLYDNAQLISLYAQAYKKYRDPHYEKVIRQTIDFLSRELRDPSGAFYSALDADSEGEEGKFYVWESKEVEAILDEKQFAIAKDYYNINEKEKWEGNIILLRKESDAEFANKRGLDLEELNDTLSQIEQLLLEARSKRVRPGLDDKSLTSWNALTMMGLLEAHEALGDPHYLDLAIACGKFLVNDQLKTDGGLYHSFKEGKSSINGFLEDYAFGIQAFVQLYENTFDEYWIDQAQKLAEHSIAHFYDEKSGYFYFNSDQDPELAVRKIEKNDNVIPASNSAICRGLFELGTLLNEQKYLRISDQLLSNSEKLIESYIPYASNWGIQLLNRAHRFYETAVVGDKVSGVKEAIQKNYLPNAILLGSRKESSRLALLKNKWVAGQTTIYVCYQGTCKQPTTKVTEALEAMAEE